MFPGFSEVQKKSRIFDFSASGQTEARFELLVVMFYPEGSYLSPLGSRTGFPRFFRGRRKHKHLCLVQSQRAAQYLASLRHKRCRAWSKVKIPNLVLLGITGLFAFSQFLAMLRIAHQVQGNVRLNHDARFKVCTKLFAKCPR